LGREVSRPNRLAGFDALRLAALAAIFAQHACSVAGLDDYPIVGGFRVGRFGTAIFFALSGYFAAASALAPGAWLARRAAHLFPAFWVVTAAGFVAAAATGHKAFDGWQVACQMAGIGLFTHPEQLVNVATWFVTLLGVLYALVYLARRAREPAVIGLAAMLAVAYAAYPHWHQFDVVACQAATFFGGYILGGAGGRLRGAPLIYVATTAALIPVQPILTYGVAALALLRVAAAVRADWPAGQIGARYAYEWFLVHGLCLHATRWAVGPGMWAMAPVAAGLAVVAAVGLREGLDGLLGRGRRLPRSGGAVSFARLVVGRAARAWRVGGATSPRGERRRV
jgi:peptidoglycan/LPS O-acetylase OafA/YrhL